jgi:hypothetical protein
MALRDPGKTDHRGNIRAEYLRFSGRIVCERDKMVVSEGKLIAFEKIKPERNFFTTSHFAWRSLQ